MRLGASDVLLRPFGSEELGSAIGRAAQRCVLEARLQGRQPVAVTEHAASQDQALHGAADKLVRLLDHALGRAYDHRGNLPDMPRARPGSAEA